MENVIQGLYRYLKYVSRIADGHARLEKLFQYRKDEEVTCSLSTQFFRSDNFHVMDSLTYVSVSFNVAVGWGALLLRIVGVPGSNIDLETGYLTELLIL